jgi:tRNA-splicing ligase RtcB (3'-phosphate/5'-hydroxy nucleic acid ligase)
MHEIQTQTGTAKVWTMINEVEDSAVQQIYNMLKHPRLFKHVAIMPDVHAGIGATIGSVIAIKNAIIPSAVGVDIGCGMCSVKSNIHVDEIKPYLKQIHDEIIKRIPRGFAHRSESQKKDVHTYGDKELISELRDYSKIGEGTLFIQLGTLGGGNHFIELQQNENGILHIMLHSGSRNIGNKLAQIHIKRAKKLTEDNKRIVPVDLDYFDTNSQDGKDYIDHMNFALRFAYENRHIMTEIVRNVIASFVTVKFEPVINIHHNYAAKEFHFGEWVWVHRKGATKVTSSITGIIPGSMGTPSYLVKGKDNPESYFSCSHGAGRTMSRRKAKEENSLETFQLQMCGIYTESVDAHHLDEAPNSYKNIDEVMQNQPDLVDIVDRFTPILNIKG